MKTSITSLSQANGAIAQLVKAGKAVDQLIMDIVLFALAHYVGEGNGDTSTLTNLINAMPKSSRTNALKYYITAHANVRWDRDEEKGERFVKISKAEKPEVTMPTVPFWDFKKDTEQSVFGLNNFHGSIKSLITRATNALNSGTVKPEERAILETELATLRALVEPKPEAVQEVAVAQAA